MFQSEVQCESCDHVWEIVFTAGQDEFKCPECSEYITIFMDDFYNSEYGEQ